MSWDVMSLIRQRNMDRLRQQEFQEESAIRQLNRRRLEQELADQTALPNDIASVLRASQGGTVPVLAGTSTPAESMDLSDLAGQNLLDLSQRRAAQTMPQLAEAVPASSLARVIQHRPQVFGTLGLQTPQAVEKANAQQAGRKKIAGILSETPTTPEDTSRWWDRITGAWVEHGLDKADDVLEARMKMKGLPKDESAKTTAFFLTTRNAYRQAGHDEDTAFASAVNDAATAFPQGGAILKELAEKFKPGAAKKTPQEIEDEAFAKKSGEVRATPKKTAEEIAEEEAAKVRGRRAGESPNERRVREAYLQAKADYLDATRQGKPRNLQTVTADIATFERILKAMPTQYDIDGMDEVQKAEADSRRQGVTAILNELYQEHKGLRSQRPMPGRLPQQSPESSGDVGAGRRTNQAQPMIDVAPGAVNQQQQKFVSVTKRLYPAKTWWTLTREEKQNVLSAINRGE